MGPAALQPCTIVGIVALFSFVFGVQNEILDDFRLSNALASLDTAGNESIPETSTLANGERQRVTARPRYPEGSLRLVGGREVNEGNVEIYHMGRWGAVCDDEWDIREGNVVCRELGFSRSVEVTDNSQFGLSRKRMWMDNIYCDGDERNLTDCRFDGWGSHDCTQREGAGVICYDPRLHSEKPNLENKTELANLILLNSTNETQPNLTLGGLSSENGTQDTIMMRDSTNPKITIREAMTGIMQVRLLGGRVREEGRVEVRFGDGPWGLVCGDGWGMLEAAVVCRMLGLGYAQAPVQSNFFGGLHLGMTLSGVQCKGRELSLADCLHDQMGWAYCPGRAENIAGVMCTEIAPDLVLDFHEIERSAYLEDRQLFFLQCAMEENCLSKTAYNHNPSVYGSLKEYYFKKFQR